MKRAAVIIAVLVCLPGAAAAQTEGRVSVGATVGQIIPSDEEVKAVTTVGVLIRLNPKRGWGPAGAFNWFRADIEDPSGAAGDFARMRIRPLMAGIAYTIGPDKVLTSFSVVAGPSFNRIDLEDAFLNRVAGTGATPTIDIENSFVVRPGVNVTVTVAPRVAIVGFGGYMFNRPDVVYRDPAGNEFRNRWKADAAVVSLAAVYSLF
jgi:hypothetical protein